MRELRRDLNLSAKPLRDDCGGYFRVEDLDRDAPVVADILGDDYGRHAAAPDLTVDGITVCETSAKRGNIVVHRTIVRPMHRS